ncbi:hypothetical protein H4582DRAFT_2050098 [Lactarius indigo]|nr:hypothetical protein H4582DRAFT_2050098 [Lactarius indigo]
MLKNVLVQYLLLSSVLTYCERSCSRLSRRRRHCLLTLVHFCASSGHLAVPFFSCRAAQSLVRSPIATVCCGASPVRPGATPACSAIAAPHSAVTPRTTQLILGMRER